MKNYLLAFLLLLFITNNACKKNEPDAPYSYWQVNNDSFSTNNVRKTIDQMRNKIEFGGGTNSSNTFYINFTVYGDFPENGSYPINSSLYPLYVEFYYMHESYIPSDYNTTLLQALKMNGQIHYLLPATWFYKYQSPSDSILITGNFILPD